MNKTDFVRLMSRVNHIRQEDAAKYLDIVLKTITEGLRKEDEIILTGFGKFYKSKVESKTGINPKTREKMVIPAYTAVKFSAGAVLKRDVGWWGR